MEKKRHLKSLFIQNDGRIVFHTNHPEATAVQPVLSQFAQLVQTPSDVHIYKLSPFSVWYAFEQGLTVEDIASFLVRFSGAGLPAGIKKQLDGWDEKNGKISLELIEEYGPCLLSREPGLFADYFPEKKPLPLCGNEAIPVDISDRGLIKQRLLEAGYPVQDKLGIDKGSPLPVSLRPHVKLRPYQKEAVQSFIHPDDGAKGDGFIILPCGSGKTIVGLGIMTRIQEDTLILVPNDTSMRQWHDELLDKTTLTAADIGTYTSERKEVKPVTITTYQMLTYQQTKGENKGIFPHYSLFDRRSWGLVIYDEVHLLPAPLFRITSNLQGRRRIGLTATFVREDGREGDIYSLIGPKRYEVGIKALQDNGWLAQPVCKEVKIPLTPGQWSSYFALSKRERFRFVSENETKLEVLDQLLRKHRGQQILIIGQYLKQLQQIAKRYSVPLLTGECTKKERQQLYDRFRKQEIGTLVLSRLANMAVDLPDAQVAIQVSGTYGSRQEEAQRIGRLLRPNKHGEPVYFYTLVSSMTKEEELAAHRQLFMMEQGYSYEWEEWYPCSSIY
ncbi:DNA excision repair protein ERCC-3 [Evansella caseinilytica]|uniref:DNA 3'-5' helicase n=1 Tax=Evansella caseinilytica TaxID=1503961 RepID=A0A1H3MLL7_9BACI|nr:DNA repair helicase XPB [Evansella caseinilytica]SDY76969.1 DNA excision repair protein ERCC-3 [Evansella caseinilytica]